MKRKTYNNVVKASKLIMKKGYEEKESLEMAVKIFDEEEEVFIGTIDDIPDELLECEFSSWEIENGKIG